MVRTRSQSKKHDTNPDDNNTEPMEIDEDDVIFQPTLLPPTLEEILPGFSSDPDIILPPFFSRISWCCIPFHDLVHGGGLGLTLDQPHIICLLP